MLIAFSEDSDHKELRASVPRCETFLRWRESIENDQLIYVPSRHRNFSSRDLYADHVNETTYVIDH